MGERILSYSSDITVNRDSSLDVVETIRVRAEGNQIRRGIFRDFPTRYQREGRTVRVGFEVQSVTRDGQNEPYDTERIDNGVRVRIGDADVMLPAASTPTSSAIARPAQIGFFDGYDELYWNVTGNGSIFPIDRAEATIRLPQPVAVRQPRHLYRRTGRERAQRRGRRRAARRDQRPHHRAARPERGPHRRRRLAEGRRRGAAAAERQPAMAGRERADGRGDRRLGRRSAASSTTPGNGPAAGPRPARSCRCSSRPTASPLPRCAM